MQDGNQAGRQGAPRKLTDTQLAVGQILQAAGVLLAHTLGELPPDDLRRRALEAERPVRVTYDAARRVVALYVALDAGEYVALELVGADDSDPATFGAPLLRLAWDRLGQAPQA